MITATYCAADIFTVRECHHIVGNPAWTNLRIDSNRRIGGELVRGSGLYAIHFQDYLLYVGQFRGTKRTPFGGDVCEARWAKHLGTLTLRDRRLSFGSRAVDCMRQLQRPAAPVSDIMNAAQLPTILVDRGRVSTFNRALFAEEHWDSLSQIVDATGLSGFAITYTQIDAYAQYDVASIRSAIESAEHSVIAQLRPRCNAQIPVGTSRNTSAAAIGELLEEALTRAFYVANLLAAPHLQALPVDLFLQQPVITMPAVDAVIDQADDDAALSSEGAFLEQLDNNFDALHAVAQLSERFTGINDAYIWYTNTNGGDLRIRCTTGKRNFLNVARIFWQPRLARFKAEINLSVERCLALGATTAKPNYRGKSVPTEATFSLPEDLEGLLNCMIEAIAEQRAIPR